MTAADGRIGLIFLEDHQVVGLGIAAALEALGGFRSHGVVGTPEALLARLAGAPAEEVRVVVADIDLGDGGMTLDLPARLGPDGPPVVFLTGHREPAIIRAAVRSGAAGLVNKDADIAELATALRLVASGHTSFRRGDLSVARSGPAEPSPREIDVLRAVVGGRSNKEIAGLVGVEERTVESHLRRMMDRYGASNRTDLAVLGLRRGWVGMPRDEGDDA